MSVSERSPLLSSRNESYSFNVVPGVTSFTVTVYDHHSIGKDKELGEADVDVSHDSSLS